MLSFVIPEHNEEALLGDTLRALRVAAESAGEAFELIVVDDNSTDRTGWGCDMNRRASRQGDQEREIVRAISEASGGRQPPETKGVDVRPTF